MSARLPTPGSDDGTWGNVLNSFLEVAHNTDGSLLNSALQQAGGITSINGKSPNSGSVTLGANDVGAMSNPMTASGDLIVGGATGSPTRLAGNASTGMKMLTQTGTGTASAAPAWTSVFNSRGGIAPSTTYQPGDIVFYRGQWVLITTTVTSTTYGPSWWDTPTLTTGTYSPVSSYIPIYQAIDFGLVNDGATDNGLAIQTALLYLWNTGGGTLQLPSGWIITGRTIIVPPYCTLRGIGMGASGTTLNLKAGSNCDVVQFMENYSASQYALLNPIIGISQGSLRNAFYAGIENLTIHGGKTNQSPNSYYHGLGIYVNPSSSSAGTDPDYDPTNWVTNVEFRYCTGDGFYHAAGRSQIRVTNTLSHYNDGNGYTMDTDSVYSNINAGGNGICGIFNQHSSCLISTAKSYENGTNAQWTSGSNYSAMQPVMYNGQMYRAINAITGDTVVPPSDPTNWATVSATSPQAWGNGFHLESSTATDLAWSAIDAQDNEANGIYLGSGCGPLAIQGSVSWPNFNKGTTASNPNNYAAVVLDNAHGCVLDIAVLQMGSSQGNAYALRVINGSNRNDLRLTDDGTTVTMLSPDSTALLGSGNSVSWNGTSLTSTLTAQNDVSITSPTSGQPLIYNGTKWINNSISGQYLCTPTQFAPSAQTALTTTSTSFAAVSSANINTGNFTAPTSGSVVVTSSFVGLISLSSDAMAFGLCAHGTIAPMIGYTTEFSGFSAEPLPVALQFIVTGLTAGSTYNFDLMWCVQSGQTATINAFGQATTSPVLGSTGTGAPVIMIVQAI